MHNANSFFMHFRWSLSGELGFLVPEWNWTPGHRPHLLSVDLYDEHHEYKGTWMRYNMPLDTVRYIEKVIRERKPYRPGW